MKSLVVIATLTLLSVSAEAKNGYMKKFKAAYPESKIIESSCLICHTNTDDYEKNSYGIDYENNMDFKAIEGLDSDLDGFTNLEEIMFGTLPGDNTSLPTPPVEPTPPSETIPPIPPTEPIPTL